MSMFSSSPARGAARSWPWYPFVLWALGCAFLPGFGMGLILGLARVNGWPMGSWYPVLIQEHGHAMVMGWGGAMILGVALQFLPRLRGAKLVGARWVPWGFACFASGMALHVLGQPLLAWGWPEAGRTARIAGAVGTWLEQLGMGGVLTLLVLTFRKGPPLSAKPGFFQIVPPAICAGFAVLAAGIYRILFSCSSLDQAASPLIDPGVNRALLELLLYGGVWVMSLGMSARLFPLNFRVRPSSTPLLWAAVACVFTGSVLALSDLICGGNSILSGLMALAWALGIALGIVASKAWHPRLPYPADKRPYRFRADPPGFGVLCAYCWAAVAGVFLLIFAARMFDLPFFGNGALGRELALHAMGAGFMTLLILSVGWKMLPGFGRSLPRRPGLLWAALALANLAVLLRVLPGTLTLLTSDGISWHASGGFFAAAGLAGLVSIALFTLSLYCSWLKM